MAQQIKQGNIFGRLGTGIGQGLAEQIPKEIERNRLAAGLKEFEQSHQDLSPMQQMARLSSIPGVTPQMIQTFGELAQRQNLSNAYMRRAGVQPGVPVPQNSSQELKNIQFGQTKPYPSVQVFNQQQPVSEGAQREDQKQENQVSQPQSVQINPLDQRLQPIAPWSEDQVATSNARYLGMGFTPQEADQLTRQAEQRSIDEKRTFQEQQKYLESQQSEVAKDLRASIETRLQKQGTELYNDITGNQLANMEREADRDLVLNPNLTKKDIVENWSKKALELAKTNSQFNALARTTGPEALLKGDEILRKLTAYRDIYKNSGNSEEYQKELMAKFNLSPQGSAAIAFERSPEVKKYIEKHTQTPTRAVLGGELKSPEKAESHARRTAIQISQIMKPEDSLLAIARDLSKKDPDFDQQSFFEQFQQDANKLNLNERQRREIAEGVPGLVPYWGDILVFPWLKKEKL